MPFEENVYNEIASICTLYRVLLCNMSLFIFKFILKISSNTKTVYDTRRLFVKLTHTTLNLSVFIEFTVLLQTMSQIAKL